MLRSDGRLNKQKRSQVVTGRSCHHDHQNSEKDHSGPFGALWVHHGLLNKFVETKKNGNM